MGDITEFHYTAREAAFARPDEAVSQALVEQTAP